MVNSPVTDPDLCARLAEDFEAAGFRSDNLRELWGADADDALARGLRSSILRATASRSGPLCTLGLLWVLGIPQSEEAVRAAMPSVGLEGLQKLGVLRVRDGVAHPTVLIRPQSFEDGGGSGELWIASDLDETALESALPTEHVLGVGGASRTLAEIVVPTPVDRVLDLGTGCGIQALLLSRRAREVIATDLSERALRYAAFNATLNGIGNITFRQGNLFEPLRGETFDLIVSNPPFVITPRAEGVPAYDYRDGGLVGDALVEHVVQGLPRHLAPGGTAQILGNWESRGTADGVERVRSWVPDDIDGWLIERDELTPLGYAELWIRDGGEIPRDHRFTTLLDAWLDDFESRDVRAIGFGMLLLHRPRAARTGHWRAERLTTPLPQPGHAFAHAVAARERLVTGLPSRLRYADDVTETRHFRPGFDDPEVIELRQGGGMGRTVLAGTALAAFVGACDGELTVAQILQALAELFDVPVSTMIAEVEPAIRELFIDGFLNEVEFPE